jgi:hypothetical protein
MAYMSMQDPGVVYVPIRGGRHEKEDPVRKLSIDSSRPHFDWENPVSDRAGQYGKNV